MLRSLLRYTDIGSFMYFLVNRNLLARMSVSMGARTGVVMQLAPCCRLGRIGYHGGGCMLGTRPMHAWYLLALS